MKHWMATAFVLLTLGASAQIRSVVEVSTDDSKQFTRFAVEHYYCDYFAKCLTTTYGESAGAGTGLMKWKNIDIPEIGNDLDVTLNDGAMILTGETWSHSTFSNAADMEAKLTAEPARSRKMYITFTRSGKDAVAKEQIVPIQRYIEACVLAE